MHFNLFLVYCYANAKTVSFETFGYPVIFDHPITCLAIVHIEIGDINGIAVNSIVFIQSEQ